MVGVSRLQYCVVSVFLQTVRMKTVSYVEKVNINIYYSPLGL